MSNEVTNEVGAVVAHVSVGEGDKEARKCGYTQ